MKKKVKTVCQIIRFRGKIEAFLVSIDLFDIPRKCESSSKKLLCDSEYCTTLSDIAYMSVMQ